LGLEALLSRHLEQLEHGLTAVAENIEIHEVASIAAIARDAAGAPVLLFAEERGTPVPAAVRAMRAHAHLVANPALLQRLFPHRLPQPAAQCLRVIIVAFCFDELMLATLRTLALPDVLALQLSEWSVGGEQHWCARPVLVRPERHDAGFSAPSATPPAALAVVTEFLSWLQRLDADMTVEGDRFARTVFARGQALCRLAVASGGIEVDLGAAGKAPMHTREDAAAVMDRLMLDFQNSLGTVAAPEPSAMAPNSCAPTAVPARAGALDLGDLRRAVAEVRVTRAETSALQFGDCQS
jgi:hypothetical protein